MIITLAGYAGSGKSTVRNLLAEKLGWPSYSMGDLFGKMAQEKGMTIEEFNSLSETSEDIDLEIDNYARKLGETENNFIMDGWIAWNFIPNSLKVFLNVDEEEAAKRILTHAKEGGREDEPDYDTTEDVKTAVRKRVGSHASRFMEYYGIKWNDLSKMDLVVDTTNISPEEVVSQIIDKMADSK